MEFYLTRGGIVEFSKGDVEKERPFIHLTVQIDRVDENGVLLWNNSQGEENGIFLDLEFPADALQEGEFEKDNPEPINILDERINVSGKCPESNRLIEKFEKEKAENELKALRAPQFRIDESGYEISDFHSYESGFYGRETSPTNPIGDKLESPCSRKLTIYCNGEEVDEIYAYGNVNLDDREGTAKAYLKSYLSRKSYLAKKGGE